MNKFCNALLLHPVIDTKDFRTHTRGIITGDFEKVKTRYIRSVLRKPETINKSVLFITYVGMKMSEVEEIKEMVEEIVSFEKVYLTKAAPSIAINCGPGTFGLIFARK